MAKSKRGGTRAYLRGRIANDVYSIGKDSKGAKQQVVRAMAEQVANPRTTEQMKQRMILSSVAQLTRVLAPFIDHSWDGIEAGQPSVSEFSRRALAAYKADTNLATPVFGYLRYGSKNIPTSGVQVSEGKLKTAFEWGENSNNSFSGGFSSGGVGIVIPNIAFVAGEGGRINDQFTYGQFIDSIFGGSTDAYITFIAIGSASADAFDKPAIQWFRITPKGGVDRDTVIPSDDNMSDYMVIESNVSIRSVQAHSGSYSEAGGHPGFEFAANPAGGTFKAIGSCMIASKKMGGKWIHNRSFMRLRSLNGSLFNPQIPSYDTWDLNELVDGNFATSLATYPLGSERFLNGGEL